MASVGKLDEEYDDSEDMILFGVTNLDGELEFDSYMRSFTYEPPVRKLEDGKDERKPLKAFVDNRAAWVLARNREEMERVQREKEEKERKEKDKKERAKAHKAVRDSILEYEPKADCEVFTRFFLRDFSVFDIDEKSPIPPMRYTDSKYEDEFGLEDSANFLSVSISSSDVGFPVNVYGRIIARDSIDYKCIYLFYHDRDDCQPIKLEGETLVLSGPGRGLVLVDFIYLEIDLKIKEDGQYPDRQFSKGLLSIDGRVLFREQDVVVRSDTLESWLSTMEVRFATVLNSVEATFEVKLLKGHFYGKITVGISGIEETIVVHDTEADGLVTCGESGVIKLHRRVMTLCLSSRKLVFHIDNKAGDVLGERSIDFTPLRTGADQVETSCGAGKFNVRVDWSLMSFRP